MTTEYDITELTKLINQLKEIQYIFYEKWGVDDIYSNSKIFEIIIANELNHILIPGHSGSRDAKDELNKEYEYKHYKETSSNHSWTFNDYSDITIEKLKTTESVIFANIDDTIFPPMFNWYIGVNGETCSKYLKYRVTELLDRKPKGHVNNRKMINFSAKQLENDLKLSKIKITDVNKLGKYYSQLKQIYQIVEKIERITNISQILTSNKFWELLVALKLNHKILSEQMGHDAIDDEKNYYEYKVSKTKSWNFQDISENVLQKYLTEKYVILAIVDKKEMTVKKIYYAHPNLVVDLLRKKLSEKSDRYMSRGGLRRLQVSLSAKDLETISAQEFLIE
jgi:hypothetical protein